jgi:hypothetical protein
VVEISLLFRKTYCYIAKDHDVIIVVNN